MTTTLVAPVQGFFECTSYVLNKSVGLKYSAKLAGSIAELFMLTYGKSDSLLETKSFCRTVDSTIGYLTEFPESINDLTAVDKQGRWTPFPVKSALKQCNKVAMFAKNMFEFIAASASLGLVNLANLSAGVHGYATTLVSSVGLNPSIVTVISDSTPVKTLVGLGITPIKNLFLTIAATFAIVDLVGILEDEKKSAPTKAIACLGLVMEICKIALVAIGTFAAAWVQSYLFVGLAIALGTAGILRTLCAEKTATAEAAPLNQSFNQLVNWVVLA